MISPVLSDLVLDVSALAGILGEGFSFCPAGVKSVAAQPALSKRRPYTLQLRKAAQVAGRFCGSRTLSAAPFGKGTGFACGIRR